MSRPCSICLHPLRVDIDRVLRDEASIRAVATRFGVNKDAVARHKIHGKANNATDNETRALDSETYTCDNEIPSGSSTITRIRIALKDSETPVEDSETSPDDSLDAHVQISGGAEFPSWLADDESTEPRTAGALAAGEPQ